ncbi:hypothetical protein EVAR_62940_1 [Eumeta japonica]|uniref:Uncharacterized protein n=1 Tax=Eumeta variegata TaxID=151549 RepID=A0A4C1ZI95_EUMVA|nr:hypothetical protein EVAR_62940_1 [Eumeta japonica]
MLWLSWLQHENGPVQTVNYNTFTECGLEVTASAVVFHPVTERFGDPLPLHLSPPSISLHQSTLHQICYPYLRDRQRSSKPYGIASVYGLKSDIFYLKPFI